MLDDIGKLDNQIRATAELLELDEYIVEKDVYVTRVIHAVSQLDHDYYRLIFQGGTCLAKAYKLVPRMSEDCDFRMEAKSLAQTLSKDTKRRCLREFRHNIITVLQQNGFVIDKSKIRVRDEGNFMSMRIEYSSFYSHVQTIKPFLAIDFFLTDVKTPTVNLPITTLIRNTLGDIVQHPEKSMECVSITETAAEKWVGLTRRIATIKNREYYNDPSLVRHIYDLYKINKAELLGNKFAQLTTKLITAEREKFKTHNIDYFKNPLYEINHALHILNTSQEWRHNWEQFIGAMVFEKNSPSYDDAMQNLCKLSEFCITEIRRIL